MLEVVVVLVVGVGSSNGSSNNIIIAIVVVVVDVVGIIIIGREASSILIDKPYCRSTDIRHLGCTSRHYPELHLWRIRVTEFTRLLKGD